MQEIEFVEACYRVEPETPAWAANLCVLAEGIFANDLGVACYAYEVLPDSMIGSPWTALTERGCDLVERSGRSPTDILPLINRRGFDEDVIRREFQAPSPRVTVASELPPRFWNLISSVLPHPATDTVGLFANVTGSRGLLLTSCTFEPARLPPRRRAHLRGICEHLASGYTVRERIAEAGRLPAAVLSSEGQLLDADDAASEPETRRRLTDAIVRMDRARCRRRRCSPGEALELWQALVDGQYSLVESFDRDGRRLILAVRVRSDIRALTPREIAVVRLAVQGLSNKKIAGRLGIATSTVSVHLRRALRKLGCASRSELVARASTLFWGG